MSKSDTKKKSDTPKKKSLDAETNQLVNYDINPYMDLAKLFFSRKRILVLHQISSYNQYVNEMIPAIMEGKHLIREVPGDEENVYIRHYIHISNLKIHSPYSDINSQFYYPLDALNKDLPYSGKLTGTVTQYLEVFNIMTKERTETIVGKPDENVPFGAIPIMVYSDLCNLKLRPEPVAQSRHCEDDPGGYFIHNGNEKVMLSVETMIQRKPMVLVKKEQNSTTLQVKVFSIPDDQFVGPSQFFAIKIKKDGLMIFLTHQLKELSVFVLLRALGMETDEDIIYCILDPNRDKTMFNILKSTLIGLKPMSREDALNTLESNIKIQKNYPVDTPQETVKRLRREHLMKILRQIIPHVHAPGMQPMHSVSRITPTGQFFDPNVDRTNMLYKAYFIGYMIYKLLKCSLKDKTDAENNRGCDDRDAMFNKTIETTGLLLGSVHYQGFQKVLHDVIDGFKKNIKNELNPISATQYIKANTIEQMLRQCISKGDCGRSTKKGLSQVLNRINLPHTITYLRKIITPIADPSTNKMVDIRSGNPTQFGNPCMLENPEGAGTGLVKNLSLTASISINNSRNQNFHIVTYLKDHMIPMENVNKKKYHSMVKIFLNWNLIGVTDNIIKIYNDLRKQKMMGKPLDRTTSLTINYEAREFYIHTDGGRMYRPYLTVSDNKINFQPEMLGKHETFEAFLKENPHVIENIDKTEELNMMLASFPTDVGRARRVMMADPITDPKMLDRINRVNRFDDNIFVRYTHCEIHPSLVFGLMVSATPYVSHNTGIRPMYSFSQSKQAPSIYIGNFLFRIDFSYFLYHPEIPLVTSRTSEFTGIHKYPCGTNCIVAFASYNGYNQEDNLVSNESNIQRGLFRIQAFKKVVEKIKKNTAPQVGQFIKPDPSKVSGMKTANYTKLNDNGYINPGTYIQDEDVLIGMVDPKPNPDENDLPFKDNSTVYRNIIPGIVDLVIPPDPSPDNHPTIKVRIVTERIPDYGDKFASKHGNKGTIGLMFHRAYGYYTKEGVVPDFILNPAGLPKRLTIGQLIESMASKVCALKGTYGDGTSFMGVDFDKINAELVELGYDAWGEEEMYNGMTGMPVRTKIFIGPTYYQRLKQMTKDKVHARPHRGPTQSLTRQPTEGRARDGGSKLGEMEQNALCGHGAAYFLKECMIDKSDKYKCYVCNLCGKLATRHPEDGYYRCFVCNNTTAISGINWAWSSKLFFQEARAMQADTQIWTTARDNFD